MRKFKGEQESDDGIYYSIFFPLSISIKLVTLTERLYSLSCSEGSKRKKLKSLIYLGWIHYTLNNGFYSHVTILFLFYFSDF